MSGVNDKTILTVKSESEWREMESQLQGYPKWIRDEFDRTKILQFQLIAQTEKLAVALKFLTHFANLNPQWEELQSFLSHSLGKFVAVRREDLEIALQYAEKDILFRDFTEDKRLRIVLNNQKKEEKQV